MKKSNDLSRSLTPLKLDGTLIAVIELRADRKSWAPSTMTGLT